MISLTTRFGGRLAVEEHGPFEILDAADQGGLRKHALVRKRGVGGGHGHERHLARAQGERRHIGHRAHPHRLGVGHRLGDPDVLEQAHGGPVARGAKRCAQGHRCVRGVLVLRHPLTLQRHDGFIESFDHGRRCVARFHGRRKDKRLEGRAGLPLGLHRAVETALLEVTSPDHRADVTGRRIHGDEGSLERRLRRGLGRSPLHTLHALRLVAGAALLDFFEAFRDLEFGGLLHVQVDRRVDLQPATVHALPAEALDECLAHLLLEVEPMRFVLPQPVVQRQLRGAGLLCLRFRDCAGVDHRLQHQVAPREGTFRADRRCIRGRRLHQAGEQRGLIDA